MRGLAKFVGVCFVVLILISIPAGYVLGSGSLHPLRRELTARQAAEAKAELAEINASVADFAVTAQDGIPLKSWIAMRAGADDSPPENWVLLFHGQGDNRLGTLGFAEFLVPAGYGVVMMDLRAQGESGGDYVTYGALEAGDERAVVDELERRYRVRNLFALGVSMGAAIALDSAGSDPRIRAVAAEAPFANLQEAGYDYVSFHHGPWLGRTILFPATLAGMYAMENAAHFDTADAAPDRAVAKRAFPVLIIADADDRTLPVRHAERVFRAAIGPKQFWLVPNASHATALGTEPREYHRRVQEFFRQYAK